jgi:hypothetical protein
VLAAEVPTTRIRTAAADMLTPLGKGDVRFRPELDPLEVAVSAFSYVHPFARHARHMATKGPSPCFASTATSLIYRSQIFFVTLLTPPEPPPELFRVCGVAAAAGDPCEASNQFREIPFTSSGDAPQNVNYYYPFQLGSEMYPTTTSNTIRNITAFTLRHLPMHKTLLASQFSFYS